MKSGSLNSALWLIVVIGIPWGIVEFIVVRGRILVPVRWGILVGVLSLPVYVGIYWYSFQGTIYQSFVGIALSFLYKAGILAGTGWFVYEFYNFSPFYYVPALFFSLFSITFIALHLVFSYLQENRFETG